MEVKVPQLPESVADATLVSWHRKAGEAVRRDENLVDLETDKVVLEVPAPANGVLVEIKVVDGATVHSGDVLAVLEPGEVAAAPEASSVAVAPTNSAGSNVDAGVGAQANAGGPQRMGPAVRDLVEAHDLDPATIAGSGREGRLTKGDVLSHIDRNRQSHVDADDSTPATSGGLRQSQNTDRREQRVAMTRLRARIAERLVEAQQTAAMLTTFNEIDMSEVMGLRKRYRDQFQERYDIKLGFMSFFVRACIEALRRYPVLNASVDGKDIIYHEYFDVGVAVSTERGLLVPVLRDTQTMSFADIERGIRDFGLRAQSGDIGMEELTGGTFTITNGGTFGSMMSTPILNPPQSGILGMHNIQQRPMVVDGEIKVRPMMYVALTYDHRIVDGREAVQFLVHIKELLEDPARLTLQI